MNRTLKNLIVGFGIFFLFIAILIFRPVPIVAEEKAVTEEGIVSEIYSNQGNDVIFRIKDTPRRFYINRGLEYGLNLEQLQNELVGETIVMKYPKYWTPLDWNNEIRHLSKVEYKGAVLFNELK